MDQWNRLARAVFGLDAGSDRGAQVDPKRSRDAIDMARRLRAEAMLAESLALGESLEQAVYRSVDALAAFKDAPPAWSLAEGVGRLPDGKVASVVGHAVLLHRRRQLDRIWPRIRHLDDATLAAHIPVEAVDAALSTGVAADRQRAIAIGTPTAAMDADVLVELAGRFMAVDERAAATALVEEVRRRPSIDLDRPHRLARSRIESWLERPARRIPAGSVPVAVLDHRSPDPAHAAPDQDDHIETLALLGNLARLTEVAFSGDDGLGELMAELGARVHPDQRVTSVGGSVHLVPVDRDASSASDVPPGTWLIAHGWHMESLFGLRTDFPYHPNIRPIFLSFHLHHLEMLTDEARVYLRRFGPVGCRDWNTVDLLLSAGVDAFFSGCLTTTLDAMFPARQTAYRGGGPTGVVDLPASAAGRTDGSISLLRHEDGRADGDGDDVSMARGALDAAARLAEYQRELDRVVTRHLREYLALTTLGIPVDFRPESPGDIEFGGLTGLRPGDARIAEMREGIRDLLAGMFETILAGTDEAGVYERWRELTRDRVAAARARFEAPAVDVPTTIDVPAAVEASMTGSQRFGPHEAVDRAVVADIVLAFDQNLLDPAAVLIESLVEHASGPLRLWVLGRGLPDAYPAWLAGAFPALPITVIPCDRITFGANGRPARIPPRITISTMDRLLVPEMLTDIDRVVYLDIDTIVFDDVRRLATMDLDGHPVAARHSTVSEASEWQRAGRRLSADTATELRRVMARRHAYGHPALNAGVLVFDLARMRRDGFSRMALGWVEQYGLNDQDSVLAYVGPERAVIESRWNALPSLEDVADPWLIHWASLGKPWESPLTFEQDRWQAYAERLHARAGRPPAS